jgi:filamentous hemagglutinin
MTTYNRVAGNLIIQSVGAANTVTFQNTAGVANVIITGDLSVSGNASLTGNISGDKLFNGTTSIEIQTASGNANVTVGGVSNVAVFTQTGLNITGTVVANGNVSGGNVNTAGQVSATGNVSGGNLTVATGNIVLTQTSGATTAQMIQFFDANTAITTVGANIGSVEWYTSDAAAGGARVTAAIKAVYSDTNGNANVLVQTNGGSTRIAILGSTGNVGFGGNVAPAHTVAVTGNIYASTQVTAVGNVVGGNLTTAGQMSATGNVTGGNIITAGNISAGTGNISGGNVIITTGATAGAGGFSATGNITGGNIISNGVANTTGNIYSGGNLLTQGYVSATGNLLGAELRVSNANVSGNSYGSGIGVENIVWQPTTVAFNSAAQANVGVLGFLALAGRSYKYEAYLPILPDGGTTTGFSTYFDAGTCYYTVEFQTTQTSTFNTATSNVSGTAPATAAMSGTTPRTARITGTIYSAGNANVAIQAQTSAANINIQSGAYLTYTRIS